MCTDVGLQAGVGSCEAMEWIRECSLCGQLQRGLRLRSAGLLLGVGVDEVGGGRGEEGLCVDQALRTQAMTGTYVEHAHGPCTCVIMLHHTVPRMPVLCVIMQACGQSSCVIY